MDIRKLQRVIVDALEDVKGADIRVFNSTGLTQLFDRVIIASGTSNRQTRALAASVRDKVKSVGGQVVSVEGEETGEWVLVDLGDAIVHIMQPTIRTYYNLEELWGVKPVSMKSHDEGVTTGPRVIAHAAPAKKAAGSAVKTTGSALKTVGAAAKTVRPAIKTGRTPVARKTAAKTAGKTAASKRSALKSASKAAARSPAKPAAKAPGATRRRTASK